LAGLRVGRFTRKHVDAMHPVLPSCSLLGSCAKTIEPRSNTNVLETDLHQIRNDLCLRQSAGDSTSPKIDIAEGILRELDIQGDIGQVKAPAGFQYSDDLGKAALFLRHEIEDAV
jgi:hypothetical protein